MKKIFKYIVLGVFAITLNSCDYEDPILVDTSLENMYVSFVLEDSISSKLNVIPNENVSIYTEEILGKPYVNFKLITENDSLILSMKFPYMGENSEVNFTGINEVFDCQIKNVTSSNFCEFIPDTNSEGYFATIDITDETMISDKIKTISGKFKIYFKDPCQNNAKISIKEGVFKNLKIVI